VGSRNRQDGVRQAHPALSLSKGEAAPPRSPGLVLASTSPRRRALLTQAGFRFRVVDPGVEETASAGLGPVETALEHARRKAGAVARCFPGSVVLAADTVVALDGQLIGKPVDPEDACHILRRLRGTSHSVITGVVVRSGEREQAGAEETELRMRRVSDEEIDAYVASGEALGKAGAYAVQEQGDRFVEILRGSYSNVVGLPVELAERLLAEFAVAPEWQGPSPTEGQVVTCHTPASPTGKDER